MLKTYLRLTKPGVMLGNLITTVAGYLLAANGRIDWPVFIATASGTALVISSACVINNILDRDIDSRMERTKNRPLITGEADPKTATIFGILLGVIGLTVLYLLTNILVVYIGLAGFITYVWLYGATSKRMSVHGTLVGSISGAMPILAGYVAARGSIDAGAIIVFLILFIWQMPEFYSIAIYRRREYAAANVPVISVVRGNEHTRRAIMAYLLLFIPVTLSLSFFGYAGYTYYLIMGVLLTYWLLVGLHAAQHASLEAWAKRMFKISLVVLVVFCGIISIENLLP